MAISLNDFKKLSTPIKSLIIIIAIFFVAYLYYFYFASTLLDKRDNLGTKLEETKRLIEEKQKVATQLQKYISEVASLKDNYKTALEKLPDQREIPGLLLSIAQAGKDAGVEFVFFEPKAPVPKVMPGQEKPASSPDTKAAAASGAKKTAAPAPEPFYEEMPVSLSVFGNFQSIVYFFEKVAKLPRIVNVSDIIISDRKEIKGRGYVISATCLIKTYMFIDKKEVKKTK